MLPNLVIIWLVFMLSFPLFFKMKIDRERATSIIIARLNRDAEDSLGFLPPTISHPLSSRKN